MQLAGLLDPELKRGEGGRSWMQKISQARMALAIEKKWTKPQILEAYLNLVPFRGELQGVSALSWNLFGKSPSGLNANEAAIAAALLRGPNAAQKKIAERACLLVAPSDCEPLKTRLTTALTGAEARRPEKSLAPHLAVRLLKKPGDRVQSTVDARLQKFARDALRARLMELTGRNVEDGAVVVLDNASGEVLAWVGSSGELSGAAEVDGVLALRQPGSTLKPFLYAEAIAEKRITAASLLEDSSSQIPTAGGLYIPQNYDRQFKGLVSARTALGASLNVPAVRTLVMVSPDAFHKQLRAVGLPLKESGDYYGYSLALGSSEVSLLALTNAYRTLANGGRYSAPSLLRQARPEFRAALDPRAAFIVTDIMADPLARARTFGTDSVLATRFWTAVKTGTSKDMRDNWALGFSQRYTVGVWVGNASGAPMWDVSGTSGAAPVWAAVMGYLHQREPSRAPTPPAGLVQSRAEFGHQLEAARSEWFIQGTEQTLFATNSGAESPRSIRATGQKHLKNSKTQPIEPDSPPRITAPASGTIIALDPDIPPQHQRVSFSAEGRGTRWHMDGKEFARGAQAQWLPWPGRHVVQLLDAGGQVVDEIRLEVRGAGVRPGKR
jgi:penicillin-binding protein 1C